jgi:P27 family predicted phage terminase small subunit
MAGRRPKPTHLRVVGGNAGKRPLNKSEPKPARERPSPPSHVSDKARETWGYVTGILDDMGVLTKADAMAVEVLCEAYADHIAARAALKDFGSSYYETVSESGSVMHRAHPAVALISDTDRRIKAWLGEFGLTPSARTRVQSSDGVDKQADPASKYFA